MASGVEIEGADGGYRLTGAQTRALRLIVEQSNEGRWTHAAQFSVATVNVLRGRGLIEGDAKLYATKLGREVSQ